MEGIKTTELFIETAHTLKTPQSRVDRMFESNIPIDTLEQENFSEVRPIRVLPTTAHATRTWPPVFTGKKKEEKRIDISEAARKRYRITGNMWSGAAWPGLIVLGIDHFLFGHTFDPYVFWIPEILGTIGAFCWYHGHKQLEAAEQGYTTRDLRLRGTLRDLFRGKTWRDIGHELHKIANSALKKVGLGEPEDLREWKN